MELNEHDAHEAWCSLHSCHPASCFPKHHRTLGGKAETPEEKAERIRQTHETRQLINRLKTRSKSNGTEP
jgi:hypothetical protein